MKMISPVSTFTPLPRSANKALWWPLIFFLPSSSSLLLLLISIGRIESSFKRSLIPRGRTKREEKLLFCFCDDLYSAQWNSREKALWILRRAGVHSSSRFQEKENSKSSESSARSGVCVSLSKRCDLCGVVARFKRIIRFGNPKFYGTHCASFFYSLFPFKQNLTWYDLLLKEWERLIIKRKKKTSEGNETIGERPQRESTRSWWSSQRVFTLRVWIRCVVLCGFV